MFKKLVIHIRKSVKFAILAVIASLLVIGAIIFLYKPTYSVTINGEQVGYTENKSQLQKRINEYLEKGEGDNVAFVQADNLPEYKLCLLKKDITPNDDDIFNMIKEHGVTYYRYYAILENQEEKLYLSKFEDAEEVVNSLKDKKSTNIDDISIVEKYETEIKDFVTSEDAVAKLYVEPVKVVKKVASTNKYTSSGSVNTSYSTSSAYADLGISLIRPVSGIISSRFGASSSIRSSSHTGLDIATSSGTPIAAAAAGTVTFSGWKGSYGNLLVITHENGVQTYYGHCSALYASVGQTVSQGQTVAAVGSTGNSTGAHLHLEVRVNGVAYNPQNYLY